MTIGHRQFFSNGLGIKTQNVGINSPVVAVLPPIFFFEKKRNSTSKLNLQFFGKKLVVSLFVLLNKPNRNRNLIFFSGKAIEKLRRYATECILSKLSTLYA